MGVSSDDNGELYMVNDASEIQFNTLSTHFDKAIILSSSSVEKTMFGQTDPKNALHNLSGFARNSRNSDNSRTMKGRISTPVFVVVVVISTVLSILAGVYVERNRNINSNNENSNTRFLFSFF